MNFPTNANAFSRWLNAAGKGDLAEALRYFCESAPPEDLEALRLIAMQARERHFGKKVYFRGLIEFSSYCKNDCYLLRPAQKQHEVPNEIPAFG